MKEKIWWLIDKAISGEAAGLTELIQALVPLVALLLVFYVVVLGGA